MKEKPQNFFIVSDATGQTCERVVRAALTQFEYQDVNIRIWSYVRTPESVEKVLRTAQAEGGIVVYTLVCPEERKRMEEMAAKLSVATVDILGPILDNFSRFLETDPKTIPGLYQELIEEDLD